MKTILCILATLFTTSFAGSIGGESIGTVDNGYSYRLGQSGGLSGGRHTDISAVKDFKHQTYGNIVSPSVGYGNLDVSGLSGGYNTLELGGHYNLEADNNAFGVGYISNSAPIDGYSGAHSGGIGGYSSSGNNENIKVIRVIHEFVRSNHGQNHGKNYVSKGATTYKLIHDYGQNNGGLSGYAYFPVNGHSSVGQSTEEPSQIIKVIHEKPTFSRNIPHTAVSYSNFEHTNSLHQGSVDSIKTFKTQGASTAYSSPQTKYLPLSQEYFPPTPSGGYKYKQ